MGVSIPKAPRPVIPQGGGVVNGGDNSLYYNTLRPGKATRQAKVSHSCAFVWRFAAKRHLTKTNETRGLSPDFLAFWAQKSNVITGLSYLLQMYIYVYTKVREKIIKYKII